MHDLPASRVRKLMSARSLVYTSVFGKCYRDINKYRSKWAMEEWSTWVETDSAFILLGLVHVEGLHPQFLAMWTLLRVGVILTLRARRFVPNTHATVKLAESCFFAFACLAEEHLGIENYPLTLKLHLCATHLLVRTCSLQRCSAVLSLAVLACSATPHPRPGAASAPVCARPMATLS